MFVYGFGVIRIALILAIAALSFFYWRRQWLSGFSVICAAPLMFCVRELICSSGSRHSSVAVKLKLPGQLRGAQHRSCRE